MATSRRDEHLLQVAGSISDGHQIAWAELTDSFQEQEDQELLAALREIEDVLGTQRLETATDARPDADTPEELREWAGLRLLERIGEGSHAEVFRALDPKLDREVALKLLYKDSTPDDGGSSTIVREGKHLARVNHPNVATVYGADQDQGRVGIWMELIRGHTLDELIEEHGPYGAMEATVIGIEVSKAVTALHSNDLVHRDIKAQNVIREEGGRLVLADFGVVSGVDPELEIDIPRGTPLYMAPEALAGEPADVTSDIYSVGVLLYYLVTGTFPVRAIDLQELQSAHERGETQFLRDARPDLPRSFAQIVDRALAREPAQRFPTAIAMEDALVESLGVATGKVHSPPTLVPLPGVGEVRDLDLDKDEEAESRRRGRTIATGASVFAALVLFGYAAVNGLESYLATGTLGLSLAAIAGILLSALSASPLSKRGVRLSPLAHLALSAAFAAPLVILATSSAREAPVGDRKLVVAIVYFNDYTEDPSIAWLRQGIPDILVNDLTPSRYIDVVSMERLAAITGGSESELAPSDAVDVARQAGAEVLATGSLLRSAEGLRILIRLQDLGDGSVLAVMSAEVESGEDVLVKADGLARSVRASLEIEASGEAGLASGVQRLKTRSVEAYRHYIQGRDDVNTRKFDEATIHFQRAIELDPEFAHAHALLSGTYYLMGERPLALAAVDRAREFSFKLDPISLAKLDLQRSQITDDWSVFADQVQNLLLLEPDEAQWHFLNAWFSVNHLRRYDGPITEYQRAMELDPGREHFFVNHMAYAYLFAGRTEEALGAAHRYVSLRPDDPHAYDCLGEILVFLGQHQEAEGALEKALELQDDFLHTMKHFAHLYQARGEQVAALEAHEKYLDARSETTEAHYQLARFYLESGEPGKALGEIAKTELENMNVVKSSYVRGMAELKRGNVQRAEHIAGELEDYLAGVGSSYGREFLHHLKGSVFIEKGLDDLAVWEFRQAALTGPLDHAFFDNALGNAYFHKGELDSAAAAYRDALRFNPHYGPARLKLAQTLERQGKSSAAGFEYERAQAVWSNADPGWESLDRARAGLKRLRRLPN